MTNCLDRLPPGAYTPEQIAKLRVYVEALDAFESKDAARIRETMNKSPQHRRHILNHRRQDRASARESDPAARRAATDR